MPARMGHLFCELFYRARGSGSTDGNFIERRSAWFNWGEILGTAIASVNRSLKQLRSSGALIFHRGRIQIRNWEKLVKLAQFNPAYLHLKKPPV
jgi:hypothetical protein